MSSILPPQFVVFASLVEGIGEEYKPHLSNAATLCDIIWLDMTKKGRSCTLALQPKIPEVLDLITNEASEAIRVQVFENPEVEGLATIFEKISAFC